MGQRSSGTVGRNKVYYEPLPDRPESIGKAAAALADGGVGHSSSSYVALRPLSELRSCVKVEVDVLGSRP